MSICARNTTLRSPERLSHRLTQMFAWIGGMAFLTQNSQNVLLASGRSENVEDVPLQNEVLKFNPI
ncbi:MAG: hypothetical protein RR513_06440, partial [Muribaculaceae bacterium]